MFYSYKICIFKTWATLKLQNIKAKNLNKLCLKLFTFFSF